MRAAGDVEAATADLNLRSLDAIHLATARRLGRDLGATVTYDERIAGAATYLGHRVVAPR
jgi:predicted nucleic acid-binding protein